MVRYTGNRYTINKRLTEREAETVERMIRKLGNLANIKDRNPKVQYELNNAAIELKKALRTSNRQYILD